MVEAILTEKLKNLAELCHGQDLEKCAISLNIEAIVDNVLNCGLNKTGLDPFSEAIRIVNILKAKSLPRGLAEGMVRKTVFEEYAVQNKSGFYGLRRVFLDNGLINSSRIPIKTLFVKNEFKAISYTPEGELTIAGEKAKAEKIVFSHYIPKKEAAGIGKLKVFGVCRYFNRKNQFDIKTTRQTFKNFHFGSAFCLNFPIEEL